MHDLGLDLLPSAFLEFSGEWYADRQRVGERERNATVCDGSLTSRKIKDMPRSAVPESELFAVWNNVQQRSIKANCHKGCFFIIPIHLATVFD